MANQYATKAQIGMIFGLLKTLNQSEYRPNIIASFTDNRTASTKELYAAEANAIIKALEAQLPKDKRTPVEQKPQKPTYDKAAYAEMCKKMREKLIALAHELGWKTASGKVDIAHLNTWLTKYGHKELNKMSAKELQAAVTQLELAKNNSQ